MTIDPLAAITLIAIHFMCAVLVHFSIHPDKRKKSPGWMTPAYITAPILVVAAIVMSIVIAARRRPRNLK